MNNGDIFAMNNITKVFPGVKALDKVTFEVKPGEVHALVGENGAGKSTLIKILSGIYRQDEGQIFYKGKEIEIKNPRHAQELGISTIYQELNLCNNLTVADNIFLGREDSKTILKYIDESSLVNKCKKYLDMLGADINPNMPVYKLTVAQKQLVEIAKALSYESEVIIMDEPTSALTLNESEKLFNIIKFLKNSGKSIIYISHRLEEVFKIADIVTVIKDGKLVGTKLLKDLTYKDIVKMMVGREIEEKYLGRHTVSTRTHGDVLLEVKNFTKNKVFENISFKLYAGEILGFSGLVGSGRSELMRAIFGLDYIDSGKIIVKGKEISFIKSSREAIEYGIGMSTEDRKKDGLFFNFNIRENVTISCLDKFVKFGYIFSGKENSIVKEYMNYLSINPPNSEIKVINLSGGNQQKVVIAKLLATAPDILIFDEPTRGIDVGSKSEIYKLTRKLAEQGKGIIFVSSELPEILTISDRIIVMNKGKIAGEFENKDATEEKIMMLAV